MMRHRGAINEGGSLTIDLSIPGMTALHRVGLAGLAMTLQALESDGVGRELQPSLTWEVSKRAVTLSWRGKGKAIFKRLLERSFRLTEQGLIWFPALGNPPDHPGQAVILHKALLSTFLQHPRSRSGTNQEENLTVEIDSETQALTFSSLRCYKHQSADFDPMRPFRVAGWLYPGGVVRHVQAETETALSEDPRRGLALLYAPVGVLYFQIHRRTSGVRPQYCLVIPEVNDLIAYASVRRVFMGQGVAQLQVAGSAEAATRVLAELEAQNAFQDVASTGCTVIAFGSVSWSKRQKTRVEIFTVPASQGRDFQPYRIAAMVFPKPQWVTGKPDAKTGQVSHWWVVPQVPDLVARNVVSEAPWWHGFSDLWQQVRDGSRRDQRQWALSNEREGLQKMVTDPRAMPDGPEAQFVRACQEAWRRRLGALSERARDQGLDFSRLADREYERVRISFARCKNTAMLRQTLTDFWSRAGPLPGLQDHWHEVLPLLQSRWKDGRDLALLALASYKPQNTDEAKVFAAEVATDIGENA